mmetsp:Transcript_19899/g.36748  ORF Transcript_19899/g.36748 Transcript_19899/m.36748 type:complete len:387 (+) Transcript_19899:4229-5389(+)
MYAWIDMLTSSFSWFSLIYGICLFSGSSDFTGYDEPLFWLLIGLLGIPLFPLICEITLNAIATSKGFPVKPELGLSGKQRIVYRPEYNISAGGIEKLHPFDSKKYGRVYAFLVESGALSQEQVVSPEKCSREVLLSVHKWTYLYYLNFSAYLTKIVEVPVCFLPSFLLRFRVLNPMLYATYGSALAGVMAIEQGWAINLAGGYHHASGSGGGGFCVYADITILISCVRKWYKARINRIMIVDLDAHQGNGHERDFLSDPETYIVDFYNPMIYPGDYVARQAIRAAVEIRPMDSDDRYISMLERTLAQSIAEFKPDFIVYNAGTDCLIGDPLGNLSLSRQAIIRRDHTVFEAGISKSIPVVMLLSGGYQQSNAPVIADSIQSLMQHF